MKYIAAKHLTLMRELHSGGYFKRDQSETDFIIENPPL